MAVLNANYNVNQMGCATHLRLPILADVPEGYVVSGVFHDYRFDGFVLRVEHESFPEVGEGAQIEMVSAIVNYVHIPLQPKKAT